VRRRRSCWYIRLPFSQTTSRLRKRRLGIDVCRFLLENLNLLPPINLPQSKSNRLFGPPLPDSRKSSIIAILCASSNTAFSCINALFARRVRRGCIICAATFRSISRFRNSLVAGFGRRRRALLCGWLRRRRGSRVLLIGVQLPESHSDSGSASTEKRSRKAIVNWLVLLSVLGGLGLEISQVEVNWDRVQMLDN